MRHINYRLYHSLEEADAHFIEQQRRDDWSRKEEHKIVHCENHRIAQLKKVRIVKKRRKVMEANPLSLLPNPR